MPSLRPLFLLTFIATTLSATSALSLARPGTAAPLANPTPLSPHPPHVHRQQQAPLVVMPPIDHNEKPQGPVLLNDVLPSNRPISIFSSLILSVEPASARLSSLQSNTTVLAPSNVAISNLPRKPWEGPSYNANSKDEEVNADLFVGEGGEDRAQENLERFVLAHLVGVSPWKEGERVQTLGGSREVWWESDGNGGRKVYPGGVEVEKVAEGVANGEVWILKGVVNY